MMTWRGPQSCDLVYLIDEPEQHLHPALQRQASSWLAGMMSGWGSAVRRCHRLRGLDLTQGDVALYEVINSRGSATRRPVDCRGISLGPAWQLARVLGIDRGQLLACCKVSPSSRRLDLAVLEELYGQRLLSSGVCVQPVHGHRNHIGLLNIPLLQVCKYCTRCGPLRRNQRGRYRGDEAFACRALRLPARRPLVRSAAWRVSSSSSANWSGGSKSSRLVPPTSSTCSTPKASERHSLSSRRSSVPRARGRSAGICQRGGGNAAARSSSSCDPHTA